MAYSNCSKESGGRQDSGSSTDNPHLQAAAPSCSIAPFWRVGATAATAAARSCFAPSWGCAPLAGRPCACWCAAALHPALAGSLLGPCPLAGLIWADLNRTSRPTSAKTGRSKIDSQPSQAKLSGIQSRYELNRTSRPSFVFLQTFFCSRVRGAALGTPPPLGCRT